MTMPLNNIAIMPKIISDLSSSVWKFENYSCFISYQTVAFLQQGHRVRMWKQASIQIPRTDFFLGQSASREVRSSEQKPLRFQPKQKTLDKNDWCSIVSLHLSSRHFSIPTLMWSGRWRRRRSRWILQKPACWELGQRPGHEIWQPWPQGRQPIWGNQKQSSPRN